MHRLRKHGPSRCRITRDKAVFGQDVLNPCKGQPLHCQISVQTGLTFGRVRAETGGDQTDMFLPLSDMAKAKENTHYALRTDDGTGWRTAVGKVNTAAPPHQRR